MMLLKLLVYGDLADLSSNSLFNFFDNKTSKVSILNGEKAWHVCVTILSQGF